MARATTWRRRGRQGRWWRRWSTNVVVLVMGAMLLGAMLLGVMLLGPMRSGNDNYEVYTVSSTGTEAKPVRNTNDPPTDPARDQEPAWSPDGGKIAFNSNRSGNVEIYTVFNSTVVEVGLARITDNLAIDEKPAWSTDGDRIVFDSNRSGGKYDIYTVGSA